MARLSDWQPLLTGSRPTGPGAGQFDVYYTTATTWCDSPQAQDGQLLCPALNWQVWPAGQSLTQLGINTPPRFTQSARC